MLGIACSYRPDRHVIVHCPLEGWLRRNVPDRRMRDLLFVYFSLEGRNYVVGMWANRGRTAFYDVLNFGPWLHGFTREDGLHFQRMLGREALSGRELGEKALALEREKVRRLQGEQEEEARRFHWRESLERGTRAFSGWRGREEGQLCTGG